jgi:hypothetical protein
MYLSNTVFSFHENRRRACLASARPALAPKCRPVFARTPEDIRIVHATSVIFRLVRPTKVSGGTYAGLTTCTTSTSCRPIFDPPGLRIVSVAGSPNGQRAFSSLPSYSIE